MFPTPLLKFKYVIKSLENSPRTLLISKGLKLRMYMRINAGMYFRGPHLSGEKQLRPFSGIKRVVEFPIEFFFYENRAIIAVFLRPG